MLRSRTALATFVVVAAGAAAAEVLVRAAFPQVAAPDPTPLKALLFGLLAVPVIYAAARWGLGAGLLAAALSTPYTVFYFWRPDPVNGPSTGLAVTVLLLALVAVVGRLRDLADKANARLLEMRVAEVTEEERSYGFGRLLDLVAEAVVVADGDGRVRVWNEAAERMFGYDATEATRLNVRDLVPDRLKGRHDAGMRRFRETGHGPLLDAGTVLELPARRKDGTEIVVEFTLSIIEPASGVGRHTLAIIRDVSERNRLLSALAARNESLQRAKDNLEAFTHVVAHDLKEPVRAVGTYLRVLREDHPDVAADARDLLTKAQGSNERLDHMLRDLLELGRTARFEPGDTRPTDLAAVLQSEDCRARYERVLRERGAELQVEDLPRVVANEAALEQVLGNLVSNAIKHNPSPTPRVRVFAQAHEAGIAEIAIEDNGPGFPDNLLADFEKSTDASLPSKSAHGGFGLLIARRTIERLGGRLWIDNRPDGATVRFTLPLAGP